MSYENFIPAVWSGAIEHELSRKCVFVEDCNRQYEGKVLKCGDSVRILGVGKPTILSSTDKAITVPSPELLADTSILMPIRQVAYFSYQVDDISKRQAENGLMEALSKETSEGVANKMDSYVAQMALSNEAVSLFPATTLVSQDTVLAQIDEAIRRLYENDVAPSSKITLTVSPRFYFLLKQAYQKLDTDNSTILENGRVGRYGNVIVKMSNNVATAKAGAEDYIMLRTDRAIAFANPLTHTEAFRPEKSFADAVKGFVLYDSKIVRPKELIVLNVKYK